MSTSDKDLRGAQQPASPAVSAGPTGHAGHVTKTAATIAEFMTFRYGNALSGPSGPSGPSAPSCPSGPAMIVPVFNPALFGTPLPVNGTVKLLDVVYLYSSSPNTVAQALAGSPLTMPAIGLVTFADPTTGNVEIANSGVINGFTNLIPNAVYYVSSTVAGAITYQPPVGYVQPIGIARSTTALQLFSGAFGVVPVGPVQFKGDAVNTGLSVDAQNNVAAGLGGLATAATDGFLYIPTIAGPPIGVPRGAGACRSAIVVDAINNKLWVYTQAGWKGVAVS